MSATYDPTLPTNADWVRFLTGDTNMAAASLSDEEIVAVIKEEIADSGTGSWTKYLAAARALQALLAQWAAAGKGTIEEQVSKLRIRRAGNQSATQAVRDRIGDLHMRGAELIREKPRVFELL